MSDHKKLLFTIGRPFSPIYSALMRLRASLYQRGVFKQHAFPVPVISIGNLTLGGTGKTPMVQYLAKNLQDKGWHPAIISRGYGGKAREAVNIVSDQEQILLDATAAGDEPRLLAESLPGIPVLTGVVRKLPARHAIDLGADILLLDDGFQHLPIKRDLDLVLFNSNSLAGNSRVFPGGDLREPVAALNRCHGFILTSSTDSNRERAKRFGDLLVTRFPGRPVFYSSYVPQKALRRDPDSSKHCIACEELSDLPLLGFCGIARPAAFNDTLSRLQIRLTGFEKFKDHHQYSDRDIFRLNNRAEKEGAQGFITTEKDFVKLKQRQFNLPLFCLSMKVSIENDFNAFVSKFLPT